MRKVGLRVEAIDIEYVCQTEDFAFGGSLCLKPEYHIFTGSESVLN